MHRWLARYEQGGLEGLADRSHRPGSCPHQMPVQVEAQILEWRRRHPGWGPRRLMPRATARPVCAAFTAVLERHGIPEEILTDTSADSPEATG